ncbi:MAG: TIGR03986 family CRISPR-associated RAMP protein [Chloroflexales bacterium]
MPLPTQIVNVPADREAYAPYNFVPLPEHVVPAESQEPIDQSVYHLKRHTGRIVCTLTTASPLYVRCGYAPEDYALNGDKAFHELSDEQKPLRAQFFHHGDDLNDEQKKLRAQFFHHGDPSMPVIPGSSLRGMLRTLVEIASYGKMDRVMDRQLFYRSVGDRQQYQPLFVENCGLVRHAPNPLAPCHRTRVHSGFLRQRGVSYVIEECDYTRIDHDAANVRGIAAIPALTPHEPLMVVKPGAGKVPNWKYQHQTIYVNADPTEQDYFFEEQRQNGRVRHHDLYLRFRGVRQASFTAGQIPNAQEGTLVITGHMQNKHLEFVFLHNPPASASPIHQIDQDMIRRFEGEDQITQWQEGAFVKDEPRRGARRDNGLLRDGEPVFFLLNADGSVRFFGRAQLFRLPYGTAPFNFVPETHRTPAKIDIAEAIFGFVRDEEQKVEGVSQTLAGRVFVGDGRFRGAKNGVWLSNDPITPQILGSPKPTTYQHYLVQTNANHPNRGYNSTPGQTTLRGHKLYWHKGNVSAKSVSETNEKMTETPSKQYTRFRPVKDGVSFSFDVRFENLSDVELGALLWVLRLAADKRYRLTLGMGKPLGMGAVAITHTVKVSDRAVRYGSLFAGDGWADGEDSLDVATQDAYVSAFEQHVLNESRETAKSLDGTLRIKCLLALLTWPGPLVHTTRYMEIERNATRIEDVIPAARRQQPRNKQLENRRSIPVINEYSSRPVLPTPVQVLREHPTHDSTDPPAADPPTEQQSNATQCEVRLGGIGKTDAAMQPQGGRILPRRARYNAAALGRKPAMNNRAIIQLHSDGTAEIIKLID